MSLIHEHFSHLESLQIFFTVCTNVANFSCADSTLVWYIFQLVRHWETKCEGARPSCLFQREGTAPLRQRGAFHPMSCLFLLGDDLAPRLSPFRTWKTPPVGTCPPPRFHCRIIITCSSVGPQKDHQNGHRVSTWGEGF